MYEELYQPIPDRARYWDRLGMDEPAGPLDAETLDRMIAAHQRAIPFENLDIVDFGRTIDLGMPALFDKMIARRRGGYCFELNALFCMLLAETGFDAASCFARSLKNRGYTQPIAHRGTIVSLDGEKLFCDVGYGGPMPACALPLEDGLRIVSCGQAFRMDRQDGPWWKLTYCGREDAKACGSDAEEAVMAFMDLPQDEVDFVPLSHFCSTHPDSVFTQWRNVNRRTENGSVSIVGDVFTKTVHGEKKRVTIESEAQYRTILEKDFGIELPGR